LERVVDAIANADRCVSTSLHGVIIAQAYEVPWVWLRLEDNQLHGDTFKFEDFFTVVDRSQVAELSVAASAVAEIDYLQVSRAARLPTLTGNLQALHDAFPTDGPWRHPTS
jgi:Tfp pilus assembly protein PilV